MRGKNQQLQIRVTAAEKLSIQRAAAQAKMDMSRWVLQKLLPTGAERFQQFAKALTKDASSARYSLAELNDWLTQLNSKAFVTAVATTPALPSNAWLANYVAAMVETAAHLKGVQPPDWTAAVLPLARPEFATELIGLRLHLLTASPPAFRRRNLFIDSSIGDRV
jgi:uncharacterized protein (DUF1778 family)